MKALQGAGRHRSLSTPELPMSVVGGLRRWSARPLETTHGGTAGGGCFFDDGFFGWCVFCFSIKNRVGFKKRRIGTFSTRNRKFYLLYFFFQTCCRSWDLMRDVRLRSWKERGFCGFWRFELKIGDRNWRAKVVYFNRSSGVSGPDVTPKIIHGAKHVLKFNR